MALRILLIIDLLWSFWLNESKYVLSSPLSFLLPLWKVDIGADSEQNRCSSDELQPMRMQTKVNWNQLSSHHAILIIPPTDSNSDDMSMVVFALSYENLSVHTIWMEWNARTSMMSMQCTACLLGNESSSRYPRSRWMCPPPMQGNERRQR